MKGLIGTSKVALLTGVVALTFGSAALTGTTDTASVSSWLSPKHVESEKSLGSDEAFEMTLHVQGAPNTTYELSVSYEGDEVGVCTNPVTPLQTNPQGKSVWTCTFDTAANETDAPLNGTILYAITDHSTLEGHISVRPAEEAEVEPTPSPSPDEEPVEASGVNHGHCVSYWAHASKAQGLRGSARGAFISSIARDGSAVSEKGEPGPDCQFQDRLDGALEGQAAAPAKAHRGTDGANTSGRKSKKTHP